MFSRIHEHTHLLSSLTKLKRLKFFSSAWRKLFTMSDTLVIPVVSLICHVMSCHVAARHGREQRTDTEITHVLNVF